MQVYTRILSRSILCISILSMGMIYSPSLSAAPPVPPGASTGGIFADYFQNIVEGAGGSPSNQCPSGQGVIGFRTTPNAYGEPICGSFGIVGSQGQTFVYSGSSWMGTDALFHSGGRVGIGTTNPLGTLHIGQSKMTGGSNPEAEILRLKIGNVTHGGNGGGFDIFERDNASSAYLDFRYATDIMTLRHDGLVGIGTRNPNAILHLSGSLDNIIDLQSTDNTWLYTQWKDNTGTRRAWMGLGQALDTFNVGMDAGANSFNVWNYAATPASNLFNVQRATGNVGIGKVLPSSVLDVYSSSVPVIRIGTTNNVSNGVQVGFTTAGSKDSEIWNWENGFFRIGTNNAERMRIDATGNVGIGTPSPGARLTIGPNLGGNAMSSVFKSNAGALGNTAGNELILGSFGFTSSNASALGIRSYRATNGTDWTTAGILLGMDVDNTPRAGGAYLALHPNGNVGIGTTSPGAKLEVAGQVKITGGAPGAGKVLTSDASGLATWSTPAGGLPAGVAGNTLYHNGTSWVASSNIYNNNGNIGIGTTTPGNTLELMRDDVDVGIRFHDPSNAWYSMGIDQSDGRKFKIGYGGTIGDNNHIVLNTDGNVGIGSPSPSAKIDIGTSDGRYAATNWYNSLRLPNAGAIYWSKNANYTFSIGQSTDTLYFGRHTSEQGSQGATSYDMMINSDGTIAMGSRLSAGSIKVASSFTDLVNDSPWYGLGVPNFMVNGNTPVQLAGYGGVYLKSANGELVMHNNGNVGIGVPIPGQKLTVAGTVESTSGGFKFPDSSIQTKSASWYDGWVGNPGYDANVIKPSKSGFSYANNAPHVGPMVHFDADGYGLQLSAQYNGGGPSISFRTRNGDAGTWNSWHRILNSTEQPYAYNMNQNVRTTDSPTFSQIYATAFNYSSDRNLKKDITPLSQSLENIQKLSGYTFVWKKDGRKDIGVIAQEVEKVFPDLVHTDAETGMKSVEYGNLVAPMIEAIKTQQKMIEEQDAHIESLEARLKALEEKMK